MVQYGARVDTRWPAESALPDFLPFAMGSTWNNDTRELEVVSPPGTDTQRVLFKGTQGAHWTIWLNGATRYVVPRPKNLSEALADAPLRASINNTELILVNCFDFADGEDLRTLSATGGWNLDELLQVTDRVSFVDIR